ncbi:aldose 1-epimerase family protein [Actinoallomurus rhizosphaericola]|uniref:aldose 1-epimerase family protein n=1 Tax=Actinoallomurus rhizosphaericola TaxID=2952536 RepID=UPI002093965C|nr:aldose 1-epimerase family protein [Actinoallomurus rhizosphaericola]MCO5996602.1 aldose 1-epimerase family protein [Actinoallomurus rhizosphaericola]
MTLSGNQYEIAAGPYAAVVTEQGGSLRALSRDGRPLVLSHDADVQPPAASGQLLAPWPNRIDRGRYEFGGEAYQLPINERALDNAIHGLVREGAWTAAEHEPHRVLLAYRLLGHSGYPFRLDLTVEYSLDAEDGLTVRLSARNAGSRPAPYGHGAHPYLTLGRPLDECSLTVTADRYLEVDERAVPESAARDVAGTPYDLRDGRRLGDSKIDNPFTGLRRDADGRAWVRLEDGTRAVALWADEAHPWLEIFTADTAPGDMRRAGVGAEPMTCPPNAFVTGTDLITLEPGAEFGGSWGIVGD